MKEQSTIPDSTCTGNQDRLYSGIQRTVMAPVLRLPVLHMEEQMGAVIPIVIITPQGTRGTLSHRRTDQRLISCVCGGGGEVRLIVGLSCGGAKCPDR